ncbi:MAG TPA: hypothetical protein VFO35_00640 [Steroidobacteraceae bacterium]|nr:hypothetical protein [Steroidobacteraceae bacterium]
MPLSPIGEFILQPVLELLVQVAGYITACIIIPVFSFGLVTVKPGPKGEMVTPRFGRIRRLPGGRFIMEAELAALFGILFWVVVAVVVWLVRRAG